LPVRQSIRLRGGGVSAGADSTISVASPIGAHPRFVRLAKDPRNDGGAIERGLSDSYVRLLGEHQDIIAILGDEVGSN